jgi:hypothetical protein
MSHAIIFHGDEITYLQDHEVTETGYHRGLKYPGHTQDAVLCDKVHRVFCFADNAEGRMAYLHILGVSLARDIKIAEAQRQFEKTLVEIQKEYFGA